MTAWRRGAAAAVTATAVLSLVYGEPPARRGPDPGAALATVTVHGRPGSFGVLGTTVPSGQSLARRAVPGWGFPAGRQPGATVVAGDGTVLMAGTDHGVRLDPASASELMVAAYTPGTGAYSTVPVRTTTGRDRVADRQGRPAGASITDLEPLADGSVAFTAWPAYRGQNVDTDGLWPVLGLLAKVDGRWQVARQWTGAELRALAPAACPEHQEVAGHSECGAFSEMATMPRSRHLIVTQHVTGPGQGNGGLVALRLDGPDAAGHYTVAVTGHYRYPMVKDPSTADPDDHLSVSPRWIRADPTGVAGAERFVVNLEVFGGERTPTSVVQEFAYDGATGAIRPVSAPLIPGDRTTAGAFLSYGMALYDSDGNLWVARANVLQGGRLAIYTPDGGRNGCRAGTAPLTVAADRTVWGRACKPDFDLLQPKGMLGVQVLVEDRVSHDIAMVTLDGMLVPIRRSGTGAKMMFQIGNLVDIGRRLLPTGANNFFDHRAGAFDAEHRLWFAARQSRLDAAEVPADQWLYSVRVGDLFDPPPVQLPDTPGRTAVVQAERTGTISTTARRPGGSATVDIDSDAYFNLCSDWPVNVGCAYDGSPGNGFVLGDDSGYGHLNGALEYRVAVGRAGRYRVSYQVSTFAVSVKARIALTVAGRTYTAPVATDGGWRTIWLEEPIHLPAGVHTITLAPPKDGGGWYLNSFTFRRL